jgi:hypothetical protein
MRQVSIAGQLESRTTELDSAGLRPEGPTSVEGVDFLSGHRCRDVRGGPYLALRNQAWFGVRRLGTAPDPLARPHQHRPSKTRCVVQLYQAAAVPDRHHPAGSAAGQHLVSLDLEHQPTVGAGGHAKDMHALDTEQFIGPGAPRRTGPTSTVSHVRVFSCQPAWSLLIVKALTPSRPTPRRQWRATQPRSTPKSPLTRACLRSDRLRRQHLRR